MTLERQRKHEQDCEYPISDDPSNQYLIVFPTPNLESGFWHVVYAHALVLWRQEGLSRYVEDLTLARISRHWRDKETVVCSVKSVWNILCTVPDAKAPDSIDSMRRHLQREKARRYTYPRSAGNPMDRWSKFWSTSNNADSVGAIGEALRHLPQNGDDESQHPEVQSLSPNEAEKRMFNKRMKHHFETVDAKHRQVAFTTISNLSLMTIVSTNAKSTQYQHLV